MRRFIKLEFKERDYKNASTEERKEMVRRIVGVLAPRVWGYLEEMDEFEANFLGDVLKYWGKRADFVIKKRYKLTAKNIIYSTYRDEDSYGKVFMYRNGAGRNRNGPSMAISWYLPGRRLYSIDVEYEYVDQLAYPQVFTKLIERAIDGILREDGWVRVKEGELSYIKKFPFFTHITQFDVGMLAGLCDLIFYRSILLSQPKEQFEEIGETEKIFNRDRSRSSGVGICDLG